MDNIFVPKLSAKYESAYINMMTTILKNNNILELFNNDMYIGGSLPSFVFSKLIIKKEYDITTLEYYNMDIYTSNYITTLCAMNTHLNPTKIKKNDSIIDVHINGPNINLLQFILANIGSFKNENNHDAFMSEVLENYDTSLIKIGYHPYTKTIIIHNDFMNDFLRKKFYHKSVFPKPSVATPKKAVCKPSVNNDEIIIDRNKKIEYRALSWYDATIEQINVTKCNWIKNYHDYNYGYVKIDSVFDFEYKGSYLKKFHNK